MLNRSQTNKLGSLNSTGKNLKYQENHMNKDIAEGKWRQIRGQLREWWGELTDDELDQAAGNADRVIGLLQERYGYSHEQAEKEFNRRLHEAELNAEQEY
jgi:uncharacterized protein YjbJ (UPF0337 family)